MGAGEGQSCVLWTDVLPCTLLCSHLPRLSLLESAWICAGADPRIAPWQWRDGCKHTWEAADSSSPTLTAPFLPTKL